ncbi:hypothetical protein [Streptomyces sp. NPDC088739]|uniref:hypothetical protein n=1 Tax=Streptomyces sp. NPDC088739 TaxID=3365882 RepID=UPI003829C02F
MKARLLFDSVADPWGAEARTATVILSAHHVDDGRPLPAGPVSGARGTAGAPPSATIQLPGLDAARLLRLLDQILEHPSYTTWAETGAPLGDRFLVVHGGRTTAPVVLVTGPMMASITAYPANAGDPGDPAYRETFAEVGYEDLAALREALASVVAGL